MQLHPGVRSGDREPDRSFAGTPARRPLSISPLSNSVRCAPAWPALGCRRRASGRGFDRRPNRASGGARGLRRRSGAGRAGLRPSPRL